MELGRGVHADGQVRSGCFLDSRWATGGGFHQAAFRSEASSSVERLEAMLGDVPADLSPEV
jgi:hypothetical protein